MLSTVYKNWNKIARDIQVGLLFFNYYSDARSNKHKKLLLLDCKTLKTETSHSSLSQVDIY